MTIGSVSVVGPTLRTYSTIAPTLCPSVASLAVQTFAVLSVSEYVKRYKKCCNDGYQWLRRSEVDEYPSVELLEDQINQFVSDIVDAVRLIPSFTAVKLFISAHRIGYQMSEYINKIFNEYKYKYKYGFD